MKRLNNKRCVNDNGNEVSMTKEWRKEVSLLIL